LTLRPGELTSLALRPDVEKEKSYNITGNEESKIQVDISGDDDPNLPDDEKFAALAQVGKRYSYQAWTQTETEAPSLKVYLNGGKADFKEAEDCPVTFTIPEGKSVTRLVAGHFNPDNHLDLGLFIATGFTGRVGEYEWEEGTHGYTYAPPSKLFETPKAWAYAPGNGFRPPFRATLTIKDLETDFNVLDGLNNVFVIPDINNTHIFEVTGHGRDYIEAEVELRHVGSVAAGEIFMDTLTAPGRSYAIRIGEDADPIFLAGLPEEGCFQRVNRLVGEVYEMKYVSKTDEPGTFWTVFTDPSQNFLPEDSLKGGAVSFHRKGEDPPAQSYRIEHNTQTSIYLSPSAGNVKAADDIEDFVHDGNPYIYVIAPPILEQQGTQFAFNENKVEEDKIHSEELPADYIQLMTNLGTVDLPIKAAFSDFDSDGDTDFVYANGNLFYKENESQ